GSSDSDFETKTAAQTITGTLSTGLVGGEVLYGSVDGGSTWVDVTAKVTGTAISWDGATLSGTSSIKFKVTDAADNDGATATQAYTLDTTAPTTTVSGIDISADTGSSDSDFETKTASQTITGTLSTGLAAGEILQGSVDGGSTWVDVTSKVSGTTISWDGATLSGTDSIKFKVTDAADNDGAVATQAYTLDTTVPTVTGIATTGSPVGSDTSVTFRVTFNGSVDNIDTSDFTLTSTGTAAGTIDSVSAGSGSTVDVVVNTISGDGTLRLDIVGGHDLADTAGNLISGGYTGGTAHTVDFTAPTTTISAIDISADTGSSDSDFETKTAAQTITATLSTGLVGGEVLYGSVDAGTTWTDITSKVTGTAISWDGATLSGISSIQLKVADAAANDGPVATQAYTLDTTAPIVSGSATTGGATGS
ncbi:MAG: hypothetical protein GY731_16335, partial [Gammaproteobacteria bacterium]|nr:hypothetical protein [Gammaproteobacteria bacterium]